MALGSLKVPLHPPLQRTALIQLFQQLLRQVVQSPRAAASTAVAPARERLPKRPLQLARAHQTKAMTAAKHAEHRRSVPVVAAVLVPLVLTLLRRRPVMVAVACRPASPGSLLPGLVVAAAAGRTKDQERAPAVLAGVAREAQAVPGFVALTLARVSPTLVVAAGAPATAPSTCLALEGTAAKALSLFGT